MGHPGELGGEPAGQFAAPSLRVLCSTQPACPPPTRTHSPLQTFLLWLCTFKLTVATSAVFLTLSLLFFFLAGGVSAKGCHQLNCATASIGSGACASNAKERQHRVLDFTSKASQPCRQAHNRLQACSADPKATHNCFRTSLPCPAPPPAPLSPTPQVGTSQSARNFTKFAGAWGFLVAAIAFYDGVCVGAAHCPGQQT